jgi:hypothetical protein
VFATNLTARIEITPERLADHLESFDNRAFTDNPRWSGCYCYYPLHDPATID